MRTGNVDVLIYMMAKGRPHVILSSSRDGDRGILPKGITKNYATESHLRGIEIWEESGIRNQLPVAKHDDAKWHQKPKNMPHRLYPFRLLSTAQVSSAKIDRGRRLVSMKNARSSLGNHGLRKALWTPSHSIYR